jgi:hypothetical protein
MSGRTSTDSTTIRHQQERDREEAGDRAEAERARLSIAGTKDLGQKPGQAADKRGVRPDRGEKTA